MDKGQQEEMLMEKYSAYKRLRNRINTKMETDEIEYYRTKFYQENPSISTQWKTANDYLNTSKRSYSNTPNIIRHEGKTFTAPREIANAINDTFL